MHAIPQPHPRRSDRPAPLRIVALLLAVVALAWALGAGLPALGERWIRQRGFAIATARLGAPVTARAVRVHLFPPSVDLSRLEVGPPEAPLAQARHASAQLRLWPFLRSGGREIRLEPVELEGLDVHLARAGDGSWELPAPPPSSTRRRLVLRDVRVDDGSLEVDAGAGRWRAERIRVRLSELARGAPAGFVASAAFGGVAFVLRLEGAASSGSLKLDRVRLDGPGAEVEGTASWGGGSLEVTARGKSLDVDRALDALRVRAPHAVGVRSGQRRGSSRLLRSQARLDLELGELTLHGVRAREVAARLSLHRGRLDVERLRAEVFGGAARGDGSWLDLGSPRKPWRARWIVRGVRLESAARGTPAEGRVTGLLSGVIDLSGAGLSPAAARRSLSGRAQLASRALVLKGVDLAALVRRHIQAPLHLLAAPRPAGPSAAPVTRFNAFAVKLSAAHGDVRLTEPALFDATGGDGSLAGELTPDGNLGLSGHLLVEPSFVTDATGGLLHPKAPLEVPMQVTGNLPTKKFHASFGKGVAGVLLSDAKPGARGRAQALDHAAERAARAIERSSASASR